MQSTGSNVRSKGPPALDEWDRRTRGLRFTQDDGLLVELARRYLVERGDQSLGLVPTRLLPPRKAHAWILFWTAARRVDDFVEQGLRGVAEWRACLEGGPAVTLAERCLEAFLRRPEGAGTRQDLMALLHRGLDGLEREAYFDKPRSFGAYLDLIRDKSETAMLILDRLLFAGEPDPTLRRHAQAFAASTQMGDDCRDARRDLARGRCFITLDELEGESSIASYVASVRFRSRRQAMCLHGLRAADAAAARFRIPAHQETSRRLSTVWRNAIASGQIRPTTRSLRLTTETKQSAPRTGTLAKSLRGELEKRFPVK